MINVTYFRRALGIYIIYYYLSLYPNLEFFFGKKLLYGGMPFLIILSALLALGKLNRWMVFALFILNLVFNHANPYILHEPNQLMSLFILLFVFFLPPSKDERADPKIVNTLVTTLGLYYLSAGVKKLLDPLWVSGDALFYLLKWDGLGRTNFLSSSLLEYPFLAKSLNYLTLLFELTFLPFLLGNRWKLLLIIGALFHFMIAQTMATGTISAIMMAWYMIKIDQQYHREPSTKATLPNEATSESAIISEKNS